MFDEEDEGESARAQERQPAHNGGIPFRTRETYARPILRSNVSSERNKNTTLTWLQGFFGNLKEIMFLVDRGRDKSGQIKIPGLYVIT